MIHPVFTQSQFQAIYVSAESCQNAMRPTIAQLIATIPEGCQNAVLL
jgi:hypothetical protein